MILFISLYFVKQTISFFGKELFFVDKVMISKVKSFFLLKE